MSNQYTRYATVAMVDTAGGGGVFLVTIFPPASSHGGTTGTLNLVAVAQFVLPFRVVVRNITFSVAVLEVGKFAGLGIYSVARNRLVHSGAVSVATTGIKTASVTAVTLEPGVYFFAWTLDGLTASLNAVPNLTQGTTAVIASEVATRFGFATNVSVAGVLPATLGGIGENLTFLLPICYMEP